MWLFKLLSLSKVNWLLGKKKLWLEMLPYWTAWLSISMWIGERQLIMSEEEEVLWETSARHLCFRCFSQIFNTFHRWSVGVFQAGISNSHCWGFFLFKQDLVPQSVLSFWQAPPSSGATNGKSFTTISYTVKQRKWQKQCKWAVCNACVLTLL